jgi:small-conductance mechanosensitive channel
MDVQIIVDTLLEIYYNFVRAIPGFVTGVAVLLVGLLVSWVLRKVIVFLLRRLRFDEAVDRVGVTGVLRGIGLAKSLAEIIGQIVFWYVLLFFLISALRSMGLADLAEMIVLLLKYVPRAIGAVIMIILGGMGAKFTGDMVGNVALGAGMTFGRSLGRLIQYVISILVIVLAVGMLGIDTAILVSSITILIAAGGLALALAFGLGARSVVRHVVASYYVRQQFRPGQAVRVGDHEGKIAGISTVFTRLDTDEGSITVPNALFVEDVVPSRSEDQ